MDFFFVGAQRYLAFRDRYSLFLRITKFEQRQGEGALSRALIHEVEQIMLFLGAIENLRTDNESVFHSALFMEFCESYGIKQSFSSAYYPHANLLAETSVKKAKRLIMDNMNADGTLNNVDFFNAMQNQNNTPGPSGVSPNWLIMGRGARSGLTELIENFNTNKDHIQSNEERILKREAEATRLIEI